MKDTNHFLVFMLDDRTFALPLEPVERVERVVEVTPVPEVPDIVSGIINYKGTILPVIDIRSRFHLPEREIQLNHQFIIVQTAKRPIALLTDTVTGSIETPAADVVPPTAIIEHMQFLQGLLKLEDGVMLILDLDNILTVKEDRALAKALKGTRKTKIKRTAK
jgi:purine-binding chemotaxis protein CheW